MYRNLLYVCAAVVYAYQLRMCEYWCVFQPDLNEFRVVSGRGACLGTINAVSPLVQQHPGGVRCGMNHMCI